MLYCVICLLFSLIFTLISLLFSSVTHILCVRMSPLALACVIFWQAQMLLMCELLQLFTVIVVAPTFFGLVEVCV